MGEISPKEGERIVTEEELEQLDSSHGATLLECLLIGLAVLQLAVVTWVSIWMWRI